MAFRSPEPARVIRYTTVESPCAVDLSAYRNTVQAIRTQDHEALDGLLERGQILKLSRSTKFEVSDEREGYAWGFVRSGRHIGKDCYLPPARLSEMKRLEDWSR